MKTKTTTKMTIREITRAVGAKQPSQREEYTWHYLRLTFPGSAEAALQMWADKIMAVVNAA